MSNLKRIVLLAVVPVVVALGCASSSKRPAGSSASASARPSAAQDLVGTASQAGTFKTLLAAATAADLVDTLKGPGPFTIFAPNDEAFAKLPPGTVEALLADKAKLQAILTYHVVSGRVMAAEVMKLGSVMTLQGGEIAIDTSDGVRLGGARVIATDVAASNGVIHVIDSVMLPPS